tara:strand:+ start:286 stop:429 length:144 start_codon:yes stop_codon:yes gene_type:complete
MNNYSLYYPKKNNNNNTEWLDDLINKLFTKKLFFKSTEEDYDKKKVN